MPGPAVPTVGLVRLSRGSAVRTALRRIRWVVLAAVACALLAGCGGGREKGKNADYDRPRPTDRR